MQINLTAFGLKQTLHADKGFFSTLLHIPLNIQDGDYTILASSNAYGLVAPASATSQIAVRRLDANVTFASSSLVFGGQTLEISGIAFCIKRHTSFRLFNNSCICKCSISISGKKRWKLCHTPFNTPFLTIRQSENFSAASSTMGGAIQC